MNVRKPELIVFIVSILFLTWLMLTPSPPEVPGNSAHIDKIEHFLAFFILMILFLRTLKYDVNRKHRTALKAGLMLILYGLLMELIQSNTGRHAESGDFIADFAGVFAALALFFFFD